MDQLDLLKKDWKRQDSVNPRLSKDALSKIIHKKSSSIVKWIFIISVLELVIPILISLFTGKMGSAEELENLGLTSFMNSYYIKSFYVFYYLVIIYFIYLFYKNYKTIATNVSSKLLLQNILKTRKIVKYYIWFNLALIPVISSILFYKIYHSENFLEQLPQDTNMLVVWVLSVILIVVLVVLFWLFYQLIYGFLLKKLNRNYKELVSNDIVL
ncbi:hypothetical protein JBL43_10355 [Aureibaculum sp. A20]|uniref:DUF4328 domain-containing protein n=1 Tax=Aureibaculum flavum TaxID=2795986 RepID=A0ABS0WRN2_9FLAO|nr:hypothetical protein [Aureibaculum flavum]MBJ2174639.1 hypothetical protein [Aureibaculum flavum]